MTRVQARETARDILEIVPLVMRTVAAELRAAGELPAPAHFGLLSILSERSRMLTELASIQGVSLPTMSNSISSMVDRGWVRREPAPDDGRGAVAVLTDAGWDVVRTVAPGHVDAVRQAMFAPLTEEQTRVLGDAMQAILEQLDPDHSLRIDLSTDADRST